MPDSLFEGRIRLIYEGTDQIVLTDEKWLSFIIEQLLSNAVKYTLKGTVTIIVSEEKEIDSYRYRNGDCTGGSAENL